MRVSSTKTAQRVEKNCYNLNRKIKNYGKSNDYPQKVLEIVNSSGTGKACVDIRIDFCEGAGFIDENLANFQVNSKQENANILLSKICRDGETFDAFAVLVKYSALGMPVEYFNIPFEQCRFEVNENKKYTGRIAVHPDWTNINGVPFNESDIKYINHYDPSKAIQEMSEAGGPESYLGQVFYWTNNGTLDYPICPFDSVITDMLTEESCSTIKHRNSKHGFLPAGMLVRRGKRYQTTADGATDRSDPKWEEDQQSADEIKRIQGDENCSKMIVVDIDTDEEMPEFKPFETKNYDGQFKDTETTCQENIARQLKVSPLLRGLDVGTGFGGDRMKIEYEIMSSRLGKRRRKISEAFKKMFEFYPTEFTDFEIKPLEYITNGSTGITQ
jgi:hypothetical protein